jgi:hypothetical protein
MTDQQLQDYLFEQLGRELAQGEIGAFPSDPWELVDRGRQWFNCARASIESAVCSNGTVYELL